MFLIQFDIYDSHSFVEIPVSGLNCRAAGKQSVGMEILDRKCAPAYNLSVRQI